MIAAPPEIKDVEETLVRHGITPRRVALVSPLALLKGRRWAFRVETDDGRVLKARMFESIEEAGRARRMREGLEEAFAPVLALHGSLVVEEWVEGVPLAEREWEPWASEAGALLGRLHARALPPDEPSTFDTGRWREGARSDLDLLTAAQRLTAAEADALGAEVARRDPSVVRAVIVHLDFSADNMLVDQRGRLRVIDNEMIGFGPAGLDLGRTFNLWPMADAGHARFRSGYDATASRPPEAIAFFRIVAALLGARIFLERSPARLAASLAQLRRFVAGDGLGEP